jgi:hypothetical protein
MAAITTTASAAAGKSSSTTAAAARPGAATADAVATPVSTPRQTLAVAVTAAGARRPTAAADVRREVDIVLRCVFYLSRFLYIVIPTTVTVKALFNYSATIDEEFDFQEGDIIAVTATPEDGWWSGELLDDSRRIPGKHIFPGNYVVVF